MNKKIALAASQWFNLAIAFTAGIDSRVSMAAAGFEKQGRYDLAADIRIKTLAIVKKYYEQTGVIYEFYDALDQRPPFACDRKGTRQPPYNIRHKMDSIRDYHWSAALCFLMLLEKEGQSTDALM